ncbi:hypothetical protein ZIOFF_042843 [Zingiber officinale]|uniref:F-box domain-containing protein n=1 Tax=Zingiber officinale TaxID=94328 RepID=A0A8J5FY41_ZINOF|nr:hypothetical protein ZIOFF_042843 [Zingiber officinale]
MGDPGMEEVLPQGCIAHALSFTSPRDACRASAVSTTLLSAAASDAVWDRFLPVDLQSVLARADRPVDCCSKRDLFFRLCDEPVLVDGGKMSTETAATRRCRRRPPQPPKAAVATTRGGCGGQWKQRRLWRRLETTSAAEGALGDR